MSRVDPPPLSLGIASSDLAPGERVRLRTEDGRELVLTVEEVTKHEDNPTQLERSLETGADRSHHSKVAQTIGAAAAGAVIGTALAGPLIGVLAVGAAVYATNREDEVGLSARQLGSSIIHLYDRGVEVAARHKLPESLSEVVKTVKEKMVEIATEVTAQPSKLPTSNESVAPYSDNMRALGAAVAVAVVGSIFMGPLMGVAAAGAAIYASTLNNAFGTATREFGGMVLGCVEKFRNGHRSLQS